METNSIVQDPTWTNNIKGMFTEHDIDCMNNYGLDLSSYDDVKGNASDIYSRVKSGNMPKGGPRWSSDMVQTFQNWMNNGYPM